jgi:hypothetical protein
MDPKTVLPFRTNMSLGCIIEVGTGYIGSTEKAVLGLDFTVYGVVANRAGKLADLARWQSLKAALHKNDMLQFDGRSFAPVSESERTPLLQFIESQMALRHSVLLLHVDYIRVIDHLKEHYKLFKVQFGDDYTVFWVCENYPGA